MFSSLGWLNEMGQLKKIELAPLSLKPTPLMVIMLGLNPQTCMFYETTI